MCGGPTAAQTQLQDEQAAFYRQAIQESSQTYGEDQQLLAQVQAIYDPILAKGPNQEGFSAEELANLNAQAVEGTATNYSSAAKAVNEKMAAEGGGDIAIPSGGQLQLQQEVANSAASQESSQENQILEADYQQGYNEFTQAGQMIMAASGQLNPTAYSGAATNAGSAASTTANEIAQEQNSWINAAIGAAGSIGSAVVEQNPGGIFGA